MARRLHIKVIEATNLINLDSDDQLNPYVVLRLKHQDKKDFFATEIKNNTNNPVWNQEFNILAVDPNDVLVINIFNKGGKKDAKICEEIQFPVNSWQILYPVERKEIDLKLKKKKTFWPAGRIVFEVEALSAGQTKRDPNVQVDKVVFADGCKIHIKCVDAKDVIKINVGAKPDPYLRFKVGDSVVKSKVATKTLNPVWNEELDIVSIKPKTDNLTVELIDNDLNRNETMMNPIIIPISEHPYGDHYVFDDYIKLNKKNAGKLHFELDFTKTKEKYVHTACSNHQHVELEPAKPVEEPEEKPAEPQPVEEKHEEEPVEEKHEEEQVEEKHEEEQVEEKHEEEAPVAAPQTEEVVTREVTVEEEEKHEEIVEPQPAEDDHAEQPENEEHKQEEGPKVVRINGGAQFKIESVKGQIIGANRLPKTNSNGSDTYAVLTVETKGAKDKKGEKVKTGVNHNTQDPVWNKDFDFEYLKEGDSLKVEVYQSHKIVGDQCIAVAEIPLKCIEENKPIEQTYKLDKPAKLPKALKKVTDFGTITFKLTHNVQSN